MTLKTEGQPGFAVDAKGNPVVDPTLNVRELVAAEVVRQDDLRAAEIRRLEAVVDGNARLSEERHVHTRRELIAGEERRIEHKEDTKTTVDTAFKNAEAAISKSEAAATDKIKSVESTVSDLKDRVLRLETTASTKIEGRADSRLNIGMIVGVIGVAFGFLTIVVMVANFMSAR